MEGKPIKWLVLLVTCLALWGCASVPHSTALETEAKASLLVTKLGRIILTVTEHRDQADQYQFRLAALAPNGIAGVSVGNHMIYVDKGIAQRALTDERWETLLRMILTHEIAHEIAGHAPNPRAVATAFRVGRPSGEVVSLWGGGPITVSLYSRDQELEADRKAIAYWKRLGVPCSLWLERFEALADRGITGDFAHPTEGRLEQANRLCAEP